MLGGRDNPYSVGSLVQIKKSRLTKNSEGTNMSVYCYLDDRMGPNGVIEAGTGTCIPEGTQGLLILGSNEYGYGPTSFFYRVLWEDKIYWADSSHVELLMKSPTNK